VGALILQQLHNLDILSPAAHISAVSPWLSLALMLAPPSSSSFTTSTSPLEPGHASTYSAA
jgi:hypothetical protein